MFLLRIENRPYLEAMPREAHRLKKLVCCLVVLLFLTKSWSQTEPGTDFSPNTVFLEFSNRGPIYSVNYDHIFQRKNKFNLSYRIGFSISGEAIGVPLGINLFVGEKGSHFEASLKLVPYIKSYQGLIGSDKDSDGQLFIVPGIGYRYQQPEGGLFYRIVFSPVVFLDPPSNDFWNMSPKLLGGISASLGWSF